MSDGPLPLTVKKSDVTSNFDMLPRDASHAAKAEAMRKDTELFWELDYLINGHNNAYMRAKMEDIKRAERNARRRRKRSSTPHPQP